MTDTERKPRLFYWEEAFDAWVPAPERIENIIEVAEQIEDGETMDIRFKRLDMTDKEFEELPEV